MRKAELVKLSIGDRRPVPLQGFEGHHILVRRGARGFTYTLRRPDPQTVSGYGFVALGPQTSFEAAVEAAVKLAKTAGRAAADPDKRRATLREAVRDRCKIPRALQYLAMSGTYGADFGNVLLAQADRPVIVEWRNAVVAKFRSDGKYTGTAIRTVLTPIASAAREAIEQGFPGHYDDWAKMAVDETEDEKRMADSRSQPYLPPDQRRLIIEAAQSEEEKRFLRWTYIFGCRPGELARANIFDVDKLVWRTKLWTRKGSKRDKVRFEPYFPPVPPQHRDELLGLMKGRSADAPLFCQASGGRWEAAAWGRVFRRILKRLKDHEIPDCSLYAFRHARITDLIMAGVDTLQVARMSGTSLLEIQKHYGKLVPNGVDDKLRGIPD